MVGALSSADPPAAEAPARAAAAAFDTTFTRDEQFFLLTTFAHNPPHQSAQDRTQPLSSKRISTTSHAGGTASIQSPGWAQTRNYFRLDFDSRKLFFDTYKSCSDERDGKAASSTREDSDGVPAGIMRRAHRRMEERENFPPPVPKQQPNLSAHTTRPRFGRRSGERSSQSCSCAGSFERAKLLGQSLVQRVEIFSIAPMKAYTVQAVNSAVLLNRLQHKMFTCRGVRCWPCFNHPSLSRYRSTIGGTGEAYRHDRKGCLLRSGTPYYTTNHF